MKNSVFLIIVPSFFNIINKHHRAIATEFTDRYTFNLLSPLYVGLSNITSILPVLLHDQHADVNFIFIYMTNTMHQILIYAK